MLNPQLIQLQKNLIKACSEGDLNTFKKIKADPHFSEIDQSIVLESIEIAFKKLKNTDTPKNHLEIIESLLTAKRLLIRHIDTIGVNQAFLLAVNLGQNKLVELLLNDSRINPNEYGNLALRVAHQSAHHEMVKLLLKQSKYLGIPFSMLVDINSSNLRQDLNAFFKNPLSFIEENCKNKLPPIELERLRTLDLQDKLIEACVLGDVNRLKNIYTHPCFSNITTEKVNEAFHIALQSGHAEIAGLLKKALIPRLFDEDVKTASQLIYMNSPYAKDKERWVSTQNLGSIISNNDGYSSIAGAEGVIKGSPLIMAGPSTTPIGYNIHLPPDNIPIKNVMVQVYGGGQAFNPGNLSEFENYALGQGTMVVTLNLPDLLKLNDYQGDMPEDLHDEIQSAIHQFYITLKHSPEKLHPLLAQMQLQDKKMFLYGASFGGMISILHAQGYPGTFNGYISHDGVLSADMHVKSDVLNRPLFRLDPAKKREIDKIQDPLLLMQNSDDSNVNAKVTLDYYKALESRNKAHLAQVCITQESNPISSDIENRGHFLPETKEAFMRYAKVGTNFMEHGLPKVPEITVWQATSQDVLANKYYKSATITEKFCAQVLEEAKLNRDLAHQLSVNQNQLWDQKLKPLFYTMFYVNYIANDKESTRRLIKELKDQDLPTDEMIKKALLAQSNVLCQYMKEAKGLDLLPEDFTSDELVAAFREKLASLDSNQDSPNLIYFMMYSLFKENPVLSESLFQEFEETDEIQEALQESKAALENALSQQRKLIARVWQGSAREALKKKSQDDLNQYIDTLKKSINKSNPDNDITLQNLAKKAIKYGNKASDVEKQIKTLTQAAQPKQSSSTRPLPAIPKPAGPPTLKSFSPAQISGILAKLISLNEKISNPFLKNSLQVLIHKIKKSGKILEEDRTEIENQLAQIIKYPGYEKYEPAQKALLQDLRAPNLPQERIARPLPRPPRPLPAITTQMLQERKKWKAVCYKLIESNHKLQRIKN